VPNKRLKIFIDYKQLSIIFCGKTDTNAPQMINLADIVYNNAVFLTNSFCYNLLFEIPKVQSVFIDCYPLFKQFQIKYFIANIFGNSFLSLIIITRFPERYPDAINDRSNPLMRLIERHR
jgi:hypothetical protein